MDTDKDKLSAKVTNVENIKPPSEGVAIRFQIKDVDRRCDVDWYKLRQLRI